MSVKVRLGLMMFFQYAIWGAWSPVLSAYLLDDLGYSGMQVGVIYSLLPLATIISPFVGGQLADRYFASQKVIAFLQFTGGVLLVFISTVSDYTVMMWMMLLYSLLYAPTLALTNSIAFINLENAEKDFGPIRVGGTLGWIAAGLLLSGWRLFANSNEALAFSGDTFLLGGILSILMGFQALTLPDTPPKKEGASPWAFLEALKMLKNKNFTIFLVISFVVSTELMFYYILTAPFLTSGRIGIPDTTVAGVMVIAQVAEIFVMAFLLPKILPKYGIRKTMIVGVLAWPIRYIIFAIGMPAWLVILSLSLHGFCYVFFFTVAFIYVDMVAPEDIRHSAQSLITLVVLGLGNYFGSLFAGWIQSYFTAEAGTNWTGVFLVPCALTILCALAFILFFRDEKAVKHAEV
ncbi:MAG: MFS transporter [Candidatus Latescibacteria bacterium]|nr:MFS transporter [Candidatus Latescibacterota bacterium]